MRYLGWRGDLVSIMFIISRVGLGLLYFMWNLGILSIFIILEMGFSGDGSFLNLIGY